MEFINHVHHSPSPLHDAPRHRVLLVEDFRDLAEVTAHFLTSCGLDVRIGPSA
jgi:hypothetical protein